MKKAAGMMMILWMVFALSACGSASDSGSGTTAARSGTTAAPVRGEEAAAPAAQDGPYNNVFDPGRVHDIQVEIDEEDWEDLKENPLDKTKYEVSVTIDGETLDRVSFSTKGNSSLHAIESLEDSERYSFKLNFGKYKKGQTYHGLDQMKLSNLYHDPSGLSDYMSYRMISQTGGYVPMAGYAWLKINGKDFGLYLTLEEIRDGWIARTQEKTGELYKPDPEWTSLDVEVPGLKFSKDKLVSYMKAARKYYGDSDLGAGLVYVDQKVKSYPAIFDNSETKAKKEDKKRLIRSLKVLNSDKDPSSVINTGEVIGYFAGHNFTMNYDSYTSIMTHNYYLYEDNGRLSIVAWDYNEAFGTMLKHAHHDMTMTQIINWGIDTPLCDAALADRPLWAWIVKDEAYLEQYHAVMRDLIEKYFESGRFEEEMAAVYGMIKPYLEKDPTFIYSMEDSENLYRYTKEFCLKRADSIRRQLDGRLSPDTSQQKDAERVDAEDIAFPDIFR